MQTFLEIVVSNAVLATLLALLAATAGRLFRRPALVHGLWLLVLLKLITPPLVPVSVSWLSRIPIPFEVKNLPASAAVAQARLEAQSADSSFPLKRTTSETTATTTRSDEGVWLLEVTETAAVEPASPSTPDPPANLAQLIDVWIQRWFVDVAVPLWLGVSLLWFGWTVMNSYRFQHLLRYARRAPASLQDQARTLAMRMGLQKCPAVWLVPGAVSPMLWFVGCTPRLLFPTKLLDQLDREQRATLLVHELAHYRRHDHWLRFIEMLVVGLCWWHPVVWWARHELHEAEEQCCDAWVVWTLSGADRSYATALLQTVAFISGSRSPLPAAASGIGQVRHLRRRLTMIMQGKTPRSLSWAGFLAVLALGVLLLPVQAQAPKSDTEQRIEELKQQLNALEQKHRAEKDSDSAKTKASAEEIAAAKADVAKSAKVAELKREEWQAAMARHQQAMAHLAQLQGKKTVTVTNRDGKEVRAYTVEFADGKAIGKFADVKPHIVYTADGKVINKIADASPYIIKSPATVKSGKEERRTIVVRVDGDVKYDKVKEAIDSFREKYGKDSPGQIILELESPKHDAKAGGKGEDKRVIQYRLAMPDTQGEDKRVIQYRLAAPDTKTAKPELKLEMGKPLHYEYIKEIEVKPGEKPLPFKIQKLPDGTKAPLILKSPDGKDGEHVFRFEFKDNKAEKPFAKTPSSKGDPTADLERKLERLQKEIAELKDALKRSR